MRFVKSRIGYSSLRLDPGILHHPGPFGDFGHDEFLELRRRIAAGDGTLRQQPLFHRGQVQRLGGLLLDAVDDVRNACCA